MLPSQNLGTNTLFKLSHSVATLSCADLIQGRCRDYQPPREAIRYESAHCVSRNCSSRKRRSRPERSKQTNQPLPSRGEPTTWPLSPLGVSTSMPKAMVVIGFNCQSAEPSFFKCSPALRVLKFQIGEAPYCGSVPYALLTRASGWLSQSLCV